MKVLVSSKALGQILKDMIEEPQAVVFLSAGIGAGSLIFVNQTGRSEMFVSSDSQDAAIVVNARWQPFIRDVTAIEDRPIVVQFSEEAIYFELKY